MGAAGRESEDSGGFGDGLANAARSIIADARQTLSEPELSDPEIIHDVRKALKRWRALMRLLTRPLGDQAEQMRIEARELMRTLSGARDVQAALDALKDLRKSDSPFSPTSMATIEARLTRLRDEAEAASLTPELRERLSRYLDFAALSVENWPLGTIDFDAIANELTVTYRRARQLVPDDWTEASAEDLHDLRRRVVEHRHQMELVEPLWPRLAKVWGQEAQRLRDRLGACQDLAVLTGFTALHQPLATWRSRIDPVIATRRAAHIDTAKRVASRLFAAKPKAFRRRIAALWNTRAKKKI